MNPRDFDYLTNLIREKSGIVLTHDKMYLLETRLMPIMRDLGCNDLDALTDRVRTNRDSRLLEQIVDAMTTNETLFFRDTKPFDALREAVFPALLGSRPAGQKIRIWSAACSTGQEPYSMAMLLEEDRARFNPDRFEIIATDLSPSALKKAASGVYSQFEVQRGLPIQMLVKYFDKDNDRWALKETIRNRVSFRPFNLLHDPAPLGTFDIIFCRNVLIYFDQDTKVAIMGRLTKALRPDGYISLGGSESALGLSSLLMPVAGQRSIYSLKR